MSVLIDRSDDMSAFQRMSGQTAPDFNINISFSFNVQSLQFIANKHRTRVHERKAMYHYQEQRQVIS